MRCTHIPLVAFLVLLLGTSVWAWDKYWLCTGNEEKGLIVNISSPEVKGIWSFDKDGGAWWNPWNDVDHQFSGWQAYSGYYCWNNGGDVLPIGSSGVPHTLNVSNLGHHIYEWNGNGWSDPLDAVDNTYYRYQDGQFTIDNNGNTGEDHFLVSTMQGWCPEGSESGYKNGLFHITDGDAPIATADPLEESDGYAYMKIYRNLYNPHEYFFWGKYGTETFNFRKLTISGNDPGYTYTFATDFIHNGGAYQLSDVLGFWQYLEGTNVHQYLLTTDNSASPVVKVWYRDRSQTSTWSSIWDDVNADLPIPADGVISLAAHKVGTRHYLYTWLSNAGLIIHDTGNDSTYLRIINDNSNYALEYMPKYSGSKLLLLPWSVGEGMDGIIASTIHHGSALIKVRTNDKQIANIQHLGLPSGQSDAPSCVPAQGPLGEGSDQSAEMLDYWHENNIMYVGGGGVFKVDFSNLPPTLTKIGMGSSTPYYRSDYGFDWNTIVRSPYENEPYILYLGAQRSPIYYPDGNNFAKITRKGIWKLDEDASSNVLAPFDTAWADTNKNLRVLLPDSSNRLLYMATREGAWGGGVGTPAHLYQRTANGTISQIARTDQPGYFHSIEWGSSSMLYYPEYLSLKNHPNKQDLGGPALIGGIGALFEDWESHYYDNHYFYNDNNYWGGGIDLYHKEGANWVTEHIVPLNHNSREDLAWFEHPSGMLVEYNPAYYGPIEAWKKVDMLAATNAWQYDRGGEDWPKYGGLFRVVYESGSWQTVDLTPWSSDGTLGFYRLDYYTGRQFMNPGVFSVDRAILPGNNQYIYFCTTIGEDFNSPGNDLTLVWYQIASNMRGLTREGWHLYPPNGRIQYSDGKYYKDVPGYLEAINANLIVIAGHIYNYAEIPVESAITSNTVWEGQVQLVKDLTVANGATLTLKPGCRVTSLGHYGITLDSGFVRVQYPDSAAPVFTAAPGLRWKGIKIRNLHPDSTLTLKHLEIHQADAGLFLDCASPRVVKVKVENCLFENNGTGIMGRGANQIQIANCLITGGAKDTLSANGDGIYFFALASGGAHVIENCVISDNQGCGIRLSSCPRSLTIRNNDIHDNLGQNGSGYTAWAGIYCYNSSPRIMTTEVSESHGYPLAAFNTSAPYLCPGPDSTNTFTLTMMPPDTYAVVLADGGFPVMNNACNNFSHNSSFNGLLISDKTASPPLRKVQRNWWGVNPPDSAQFAPRSNYDFAFYLTGPESFPSNLPDRGLYTVDSTAYDLLIEALTLAEQDNYSQAYQMLFNLVENYPEACDAVSQALPHFLQIGAQAGIILQNLYTYLDNLYLANPGTLVGKTARKVRNDCSVLLGDCQTAIDDYQTIIDNPPSLTDSVFAVLDANQASLLMSGFGMPGIQAMNQMAPLNPVTLMEYMKRERRLMALLYGQGPGTAAPGLPQSFVLHQNYPNPFNPTTTIGYELPEASQVRICVYNIMGQKVITLVDGPVQAGIHKVVWDMSRSGQELATGIYIYRMEATGRVSGQKFVTAKKMLMLK